ncbi:Zn(2)-C6 fungal-type DNA-binding domain protein [Niveomyces insectorum RCEF 264]|uniref:Zn(2)-C6 fungal-type DNA-binding domain protein n=1 Tax=Niveomyces insectorum RCEF 264 TaxID=1081102 RepID=A0A167TYI3_9HYPO|nr:Zn(2)-C6 fungal-type DNA-binding domain protein [Niveomyces insectorum RCEF 264]
MAHQTKVAKRSACDRCREKRVRCPRTEQSTSTEPCPRCVRAGVACVTGSPGLLGRPRKAVAGVGGGGRGGGGGNGGRQPWGSLDLFPRDNNPVATQPAARLGGTSCPSAADDSGPLTTFADSPMMASTMMWHALDDAAPPSDLPSDLLGGSRPAHLAEPAPGGAKQQAALPDLADPWPSSDAVADVYGFTLAEQDAALRGGSSSFLELASPDGLGTIAPQQALLLDDAGTMDMVGVDHHQHHHHTSLGRLLDGEPLDAGGLGEDFDFSYDRHAAKAREATVALARFNEKIACRLAEIEAYQRRPMVMIEACMDAMDDPAQNPTAQALECTKEFTDIVQGLNASLQRRPCSSSSSSSPALPWSSSKAIAPAAAAAAAEAAPRPAVISTHTALLVLSSYLQLMQFFDGLFGHLTRVLREVPPEAIAASRVKAVLRVRGVSTMQDVGAKSYAKIMVEILQSQMQDMERQMGLADRYCVSGKSSAVPNGVFSNMDMAPLLQVVMAQEDIRSPQTGKSHAESIREHIKGALALLDGS